MCGFQHSAGERKRRENGLSILETVRICVLERPVFDTHAFFIVGSITHEFTTTLAQRGGEARGAPGTKGSAIPACAVSNCEIAHTAARARVFAARPEIPYVGTMAQDLLETYPAAVITDKDGFYRVDYDQIDVDMMRLA